MSIDLRKLNDDLIEAFASYQFNQDHPMPTDPIHRDVSSRPAWLPKYQSDPIFRAKVQSLTAGVMAIVESNLSGQEKGE